MASNRYDIDELLSGMLDGVLSRDEEKALDQMMLEDPSLHSRLEELAALRSSLLRGRQTGRLPRNFSARVVNAASERASLLAEDSPDWVAPIEDRIVPGPAKIESDYRERLWIPFLSVVTASAIVFLAITFPRPPSGPKMAGKMEGDEVALAEENPLLVPQVAPDAAPSFTEPRNPAEALAVDSHRHPEQIASDVSTATPHLKELPPAQSNRTDSQIAAHDGGDGNSIPPTIPAVRDPAGTDSALATLEPPAAEPDADAMSSPEVPFMLMAVSVTVDPVADKNRTLSRILQRHGIVVEDDLAMSSEGIESLVATGLTGELSSQGAQVYFLKGRARNLSAALDDFCMNYDDFPEFSINLTVDDSAKQLVDQLDGVSVGGSDGVATKLTAETEQGLVSGFARGPRTSSPISQQRRGAFPARGLIPQLDVNPIAHILLIVQREAGQPADEQVEDSQEVESSPTGEAVD